MNTTKLVTLYDVSTKTLQDVALPRLFGYNPVWFGDTTTVERVLCPVARDLLVFAYPKDGEEISAIIPPSHQVAVYIGGTPKDDTTLVGVACRDTWEAFLRHHGENPDDYASHIADSSVTCRKEYASDLTTAPDWV